MGIWRKIAKGLAKVLITRPTGPHEKADFDENREHDENGDLTQNRQRFNENSWKKAIWAKMANTVKTMI